MTAGGAVEASQLARLAEELNLELAGGVVQDVRVAGRDLLVLAVRVPGATHHLGLSVLPGAAGPLVHSRRPPRDAQAAAGTTFWQLVRSRLMAANLDSVSHPPGERSLLFRWRRGEQRSTLLATFHGARPDLVLLDDDGTLADLRGRVRRGEGLSRLIRSGAQTAPGGLGLDEWSRSLRAARAGLLAREELEALRARAAAAATRAGAREERIARDLERLGDAASLRRQAEALAAHLHAVQPGQDALEVGGWPDADADPPIRIRLDPSRSAADNLQRAWQRARKAERGMKQVLARLEEARAASRSARALADEASALAEEIGTEGPVDEAGLRRLEELRERAAESLPRERSRQRPKRRDGAPALPFRRHVSRDGLPILVGRGAAANDQLTFRVASGNDLWLHARGVPGSHVVIRLPKGAEIPQETLLDAATLAHLASRRKAEPKGEVTWCRVKDVRKAKGMPPGQVLVSQEKTIVVRVEDDRVERLRASGEEDG